MISYNSENAFQLENESKISTWLEGVILNENYNLGEINYIFCNDDYLHKLNVEFLQHDTLTDIISFDYTIGKIIQGDIYISTERVSDNAKDFNVSNTDELHRVMVHGVLHYCGYKDKTAEEVKLMREKENHYLKELANIQ
ncbi:rRNA maturation RNase YbeY [Xanthomarina sp. F2636L]|uniref:rRNA maturation RNase YbeY n=1 Tax=Xanthomarina sp. F2636L TaxID=2996018 RepID=UPI00225E6123|nr:rRNA maturation RNase YbeY [Xanthomarina sp. F2636L]MCX7551304.1 rRNA maturation RNase YbeY [Xanthomarina sp. F2636L]